MTQETQETEQKAITDDELVEMFDQGFLSALQKVAKRAKETHLPDEEVKFFHVTMIMQFSELEKPLKYEDVHHQCRLQLKPVTQKDIDESQRAAEEANEKANESE